MSSTPVSSTRPAAASSGIAIANRQLTIDGKPFLVLGGELHNSSASTRSDLDARWPRLKELGVNTVLAPISWELIEPKEGEFDFTSLEFLLDGARANDLKLVPLWFGSWKNGLSSYRPAWMKRDPARFPLARRADGSRVQVLSAFSSENRDADARAFAALMRRIRELDSREKTVIMVQVENEVGVLGTSRDQSDAASAVYTAPVDPAFLSALATDRAAVKPSIARALDSSRPGASWPETFGDSLDTDELFQALAYARYVDRVTATGRAEYELPYFVNTWLDSPAYTPESSVTAPFGGQVPGNYPSGGPLPQVAAAWHFGAPNLTMTTPDIYWGDFAEWCDAYSSANPAFFVPEMKKDASGVPSIHIAIGSYGAIGTSPFGIDGEDDEYPREHKELLATTYRALAGMSDQILAAQARHEIVGFALTDERSEITADLGEHRLRIVRDMDTGRLPSLPVAWGLVATDGAGGFLGTGAGFSVTFESPGSADGSPGSPSGPDGPDGPSSDVAIGLERVESGYFVEGTWITTQVLNGDETISGEFWRFPYLVRVPDASFGESFSEARVIRAKTYRY